MLSRRLAGKVDRPFHPPLQRWTDLQGEFFQQPQDAAAKVEVLRTGDALEFKACLVGSR